VTVLIYILRSITDGKLYIGWSNDLRNRLKIGFERKYLKSRIK
jgi:predicted GIY-YIG superfamily endonuclease